MAGGVGRWSRGGGAGVRGGSWGLPPGERGNGNRVCTGDRFAPAKNRSRPPFMLNGQAPCARSSGAVLRLSCVLRACPALAGTTTSEALASSAIEGAQHLVRHEIGRASCRERVCQYVYISVVAVSLKKKTKRNKLK